MVKLAFMLILPVYLFSCDVFKDDMSDCGMYLEFRYDHNMEFADAFDSQVGNVDVLVFDADGHYIFTKQALREELVEGNRMLLSDGLIAGNDYKILVFGGLSDKFKVTDSNGYAPQKGITKMESMQVSLERTSAVVSHEFPSLWICPASSIEYKTDLSVTPVSLIKDTNRFNIILKNKEGDNKPEGIELRYTFEIETPEGAIYGYDNIAKVMQKLSYTPYYLKEGEKPDQMLVGRINTMRLVDAQGYDYKLKIHNTKTGKMVWEQDLIKLINEIGRTAPDGTKLSLQEFLDRQSEWNFVVLFKHEWEGDDKGFITIEIIINGWLVWNNDIEV